MIDIQIDMSDLAQKIAPVEPPPLLWNFHRATASNTTAARNSNFTKENNSNIGAVIQRGMK